MTDDDDNRPRRGIARLEGEIARFYAPFRNVEICLIDKPEEGLPLIELRIREGRRITQFELDGETAAKLGQALEQWAGRAECGGDKNHMEGPETSGESGESGEAD